MYYDVKRTLSHNCLFNFVIGARGVGKTFSAKRYCIDRFLKYGDQFIYVRRYKQELKRMTQFFADIASFYPNHEFSVKGKDFFIDGKLTGYSLPLSTAKIEKSTAFPKVTTIIFDEFILDNGVYRYLTDEVIAFFEMYETIARLRTTDVKVIFISNAISSVNPYFSYFKIKLNDKEFQRHGEILIHVVRADEFMKAKKQTKFAQIIAGTTYDKYAIENDFLRDNDTFIGKKTAFSTYYFTMIIDELKCGVWIDYTEGIITVSNDIDHSYKLTYAFTTPDHNENTMIMNSKDNRIVTFKQQFNLGNVRFENQELKQKCLRIMGNRRAI